MPQGSLTPTVTAAGGYAMILRLLSGAPLSLLTPGSMQPQPAVDVDAIRRNRLLMQSPGANVAPAPSLLTRAPDS